MDDISREVVILCLGYVGLRGGAKEGIREEGGEGEGREGLYLLHKPGQKADRSLCDGAAGAARTGLACQARGRISVARRRSAH